MAVKQRAMSCPYTNPCRISSTHGQPGSVQSGQNVAGHQPLGFGNQVTQICVTLPDVLDRFRVFSFERWRVLSEEQTLRDVVRFHLQDFPKL